MSTKTISITTEAYSVLKSKKRKKESFSDVIIRSFPKHSLLDLAGTINDKEAEEIEKHIKELRAHTRKKMDRIAKELQ